jgi:hypothetical protein
MCSLFAVSGIKELRAAGGSSGHEIMKSMNLDGFVKSQSVLLGAGLRFNPALLDNNLALGIQG